MVLKKIIIAFSALLFGLVLLSCDLPSNGNSENNDQDGFRISFDANGGTGSLDSILFDSGDSMNLPENDGAISREGYIFISWNTASDRSGTEYVQQAYIAPDDDDLTLYAQWYKSYDIGDFGPGGGLVFYRRFDYSSVFYYPAWMYLEVAPKSTEEERTWGEDSPAFYLGDTTSQSVGSGLENTHLITTKFAGDYAAHYCKNLNTGDSANNDWYLPSRLELTYMRENLFTINLGDFETASGDDDPKKFYWSSSQGTSPNQGKAYVVYFDEEDSAFTQVNVHNKANEYYVRAARRF
jgi:uncharacterized repeat protein (TIGR02543 family)